MYEKDANPGTTENMANFGFERNAKTIVTYFCILQIYFHVPSPTKLA